MSKIFFVALLVLWGSEKNSSAGVLDQFSSFFYVAQSDSALNLEKQTFVSPEAKAVLETISKAKSDGKKVLLISSAAWCGPCAMLHKALEAKPEILQRISTGYRVLFLEERLLTPGIQHFFPVQQFWYPMVVSYDPAQGKWHHINAILSSEEERGGDEAQNLEKSLLALEAGKASFSDVLEKVQLAIKSGTKFNEQGTELEQAASGNLYRVLAWMPFELRNESYKEVFMNLARSIRANNELFMDLTNEEFTMNKWLLMENTRAMINRSFSTFEEIKELLPFQEAEANSDVAHKFKMYWSNPLSGIYYQEGNQRAAAVCDSMVEALAATLPKDAKDLSRTVLRSHLTCAVLGAQAALISKADANKVLLAAVEKIEKDPGLKSASMANSLMVAAAFLENFEIALTQLEFVIEENKKNFEGDRAELEKKIQEAESKNDSETLKSLRSEKEIEDLIQANTLRVYGSQKAAWSIGKQVEAAHEANGSSDHHPSQPDQTIAVLEFKAVADAALFGKVETSWLEGCAAYGFSSSELPLDSGKITYHREEQKIITTKGVWKETSERGTCTLTIQFNADGTTKSRSGICRPNSP